jgi:cell division protein FtsB
MRFVTVVLLGLLGLVHAELWFGKGGVPRTDRAERAAAGPEDGQRRGAPAQRAAGAEVRDLKEGLEMVEEKARYELGMVKPDEILVQVSTPRR